MDIKDLLRHTLTYKYVYHPYCMRKAKESRLRKYEYLRDKAPELLKIIIDIFNKEGVDYWLEFGTLLGAYRDKSIIKGDFDLDFGAYLQDVPRIYSAFTKAGFKLVREFDEIGRNGLEQTYYNGVITFDVFYFSENDKETVICYGFEPIPNESVVKTPRYCKVFSWSFEKFTLADYEFLGSIVKIPSNIEEHLKETYGENWRTPDPNFTQGFNRKNYDLNERKGMGFQYK